MVFCCRLGEEYDQQDNIIHETDSYFVVPALGQMKSMWDTTWIYVLISTKKHYEGIGGLPTNLHQELEELLNKTKTRISELTESPVVIFEHGPRVCDIRGGGCLDHTHLHLVTFDKLLAPLVAADITQRLGEKQYLKMQREQSFQFLQDIYNKRETSYLFIEEYTEKRYALVVNFPLPDQYIRRIIAKEKHIRAWNWKIHEQRKLFEKTVRYLQKNF